MFNEVDFEDLRVQAERMSPRQSADISARQLLMLCDEIARLKLVEAQVTDMQKVTDAAQAKMLLAQAHLRIATEALERACITKTLCQVSHPCVFCEALAKLKAPAPTHWTEHAAQDLMNREHLPDTDESKSRTTYLCPTCNYAIPEAAQIIHLLSQSRDLLSAYAPKDVRIVSTTLAEIDKALTAKSGDKTPLNGDAFAAAAQYARKAHPGFPPNAENILLMETREHFLEGWKARSAIAEKGKKDA